MTAAATYAIIYNKVQASSHVMAHMRRNGRRVNL